MAQKRCVRCKCFMKARSRSRTCPRCRRGVKPKTKRRKRYKKRRLSGEAVNNLNYCHEYLANHPCVDCGETDIVVLQFDHVRGRKRGNVSSLARTKPLSIVKREIAKCDIRCANCHVRKTAKEQGWFKAKGKD